MVVTPSTARQVLASLQVLAASFCLQVLAAPLRAQESPAPVEAPAPIASITAAAEAPVVAEAPVAPAVAAPPQAPVAPQLSAQAAGDLGSRRVAAGLFWADGITRADELEVYKATGLNTVVVRLFWQPSPDGSLNAADLEPQRAFAETAARKGLKIIYALPPAPVEMEGEFRIAASSKAYFGVWTAWVSGAVSRLKDTPNLIGWALPDDPRELPYTDEVGWQKWLSSNFASPAFLNSQWKTEFPAFDDASLQATEEMLANWRGALSPFEESANGEQPSVKLRVAAKSDPSWMFPPAALALAHYKWDAYRALTQAWVEVIEQNDPQHPIFSGRLPDYAQLLSLPPSVSVSVPDLEPGVAEPDALTHNPQAIAMARRGGRFQAIPMLLTRGSGAVAAGFVPALMPRWIESALINGASGVCFAMWSDILQNEALRQSITATLASHPAPEWNRTPISTSAVVLSPLADGMTLQLGRAAPSKPRGLYGFGDFLIPNEPSNLAFALRWGTAFGSVDFLSTDDFAADGSQLSRYSTVLLPCALSLSLDQSGGLLNYVHNGGVLVADLGAGAAQTASNVTMMPPALASLFGIAPQMTARRTSFNLQMLEPHPLLPTWGQARVGTLLSGGDAGRGAAFAGLTGYPIAMGTTRAVALGNQWLQVLPNNSNGVRPTRAIRSSLLANEQNGTAFFAPWLLWSNWKPGQTGFDAFHGDLLARNAALAASGAASLVPQPVGASAPGWAPIVNYADGVALFNPSPQLSAPNPLPGSVQSSALARPLPGALAAPNSNSSNRSAANPYALGSPDNRPVDSNTPQQDDFPPGSLAAAVQTAGVGNFVWSGALALFDPSAGFAVVGGRPAPIDNPDESESRPEPVVLQVLIRPGESKMARLIPIRAQNLAGGPLLVHGARYDSNGITVRMWPNATQVSVRNGEYAIGIAQEAPVRLTFCSGAYAIAPRSRHRVTLTTAIAEQAPPPPTAKSKRGSRTAVATVRGQLPLPPRTVAQVVTADERGRFTVEATGVTIAVDIAPA